MGAVIGLLLALLFRGSSPALAAESSETSAPAIAAEASDVVSSPALTADSDGVMSSPAKSAEEDGDMSAPVQAVEQDGIASSQSKSAEEDFATSSPALAADRGSTASLEAENAGTVSSTVSAPETGSFEEQGGLTAAAAAVGVIGVAAFASQSSETSEADTKRSGDRGRDTKGVSPGARQGLEPAAAAALVGTAARTASRSEDVPDGQDRAKRAQDRAKRIADVISKAEASLETESPDDSRELTSMPAEEDDQARRIADAKALAEASLPSTRVALQAEGRGNLLIHDDTKNLAERRKKLFPVTDSRNKRARLIFFEEEEPSTQTDGNVNPNFAPGQRVTILAPPAIKGKEGEVIKYLPGEASFSVRVDGGSVLNVLTENLRAAVSTASAARLNPAASSTASVAAAPENKAKDRDLDFVPEQRVLLLGPPALAGKTGSVIDCTPNGSYTVRLESGSVFNIRRGNLQDAAAPVTAADSSFAAVDPARDYEDELKFTPGQRVRVLSPPAMEGKQGVIVLFNRSVDSFLVGLDGGSVFYIRAQDLQELGGSRSSVEEQVDDYNLQFLLDQRVSLLGPPSLAGMSGRIIKYATTGDYIVRLDSGSVFSIQEENLQPFEVREAEEKRLAQEKTQKEEEERALAAQKAEEKRIAAEAEAKRKAEEERLALEKAQREEEERALAAQKAEEERIAAEAAAKKKAEGRGSRESPRSSEG
eukprot:TRINITY_DN8283_c1_g1_i2.p1 TRINITY_DN8283_c1_g1~~TRINITY_DN8283_c1_g1_i2.p1  ORF type:complete len:803 (-),score=187.66 TRINITY_DN8283_c1_g1_i2:212-2338(-)